MNQSDKNYLQSKVNGGQQKVLVNERLTGETDELDPNFKVTLNAKLKSHEHAFVVGKKVNDQSQK